MYSVTDLELRDAVARQSEMRAMLASATAQRDALKASPEAAKDGPQREALVQAESQVAASQASLDSTTKRVEQLKSVLGDMSIAMSDYNATQTELAATRDELRKVRAQLDRLQSVASTVAVQWAQHPVADAK